LPSDNIFHWAISNLFQWSNLRAAFVGSLVERDRTELNRLYAQVSAAYRASPFSHEYADVDLVDSVVAEAIVRAQRRPAEPLRLAMCEAVWRLLYEEPVIVGMPQQPDFKHLSLPDLHALRTLLIVKQRVLGDPDTYVDIWREKAIRILEGLLGYFPPYAFESSDSSSAQFTVPLIDLCPDAAEAIERTMGTMYDDDVVRAGLFDLVRHRLDDNLCRASGLTREEALRGRALVLPTAAKNKTGYEIVSSYLSGTPFPRLFLADIPFSIPDAARFEHTHIIAGSGHGKTQLLQHFMTHDLRAEKPPALVVIDSQGDMIAKLQRLVPDAILIDPRNAPQLNVFDINQDRLKQYGPAMREQVLNGIIDLYDYLFGSLLGAELTQKQSVFFRYCLRLLLALPEQKGRNATIIDLLNLMEQPAPYLKAVDVLPPIQQRFFQNDKLGFFSPAFKQTKEQISYRLSAILENDTFARMLSAPTNEIDMFTALNSGKVVLVNTAKDYLKAERSSFLGRLFISLTMNAAFERAALAQEDRYPAFLYIDEASEYFDDNIDDLLIQARKFNLGLVFSHQYLDQCTPALRASIAANTAVKMAGGVSDRDARAMAADMRTTPEFILAQRKDAGSSQFACSIRGQSAVSLMVPFGTLEKAVEGRPVLSPPRTEKEAPGVRLHHPDLPWRLEKEPEPDVSDWSDPDAAQ
jgi:hypothetical protein